MEIKQTLKLSQQLVMTPQLQQAIRLLQLSRLELIDEIRKELDGNPVLADEEVDPRAREADGRRPRRARSARAESPDAPAIGVGDATASADLDEARADEKAVQEIDWEQFLENRPSSSPCPPTAAASTSCRPSSRTSPRATRLVDHLQLAAADDRLQRQRAQLRRAGHRQPRRERLPRSQGRSSAPNGERTPDVTIEELAHEAGLDPEDAPRSCCAIMQEWDPVGRAARDPARVPAASRPRCSATTTSSWPSSTSTSTTWKSTTTRPSRAT